MFMRIRSAAAGAVLLVVAAATGAATTLGPMATVKQASDRIIAILSDPAVPRPEQWESATPAEQQQFVDYFSQYLESTCRDKIEAYSGQRIEYTGEKIRGERASVSSFIHAEAIRIPVDYHVRRNDKGEWKAYDVTVEGVSLVNSYRETHAAIARSSGIAGVLADVKRRAGEAA